MTTPTRSATHTTASPAAVTGRELFTIPLAPVAGSRFQPTGFPDLGAALFQKPGPDGDWVDALVVESAQSVANWLESAAWDRATDQPAETVARLPYVRVTHADDGRFLTSSRTEAHRLASAFVKDSTLDGRPMREVIRERLGLRDDCPVSPRQIAEAVFSLDPFCLLHGVFFAEKANIWPGQPRIPRVITGFIEATDVRRAQYGGVKRDHVRHAIGDNQRPGSNGDDPAEDGAEAEPVNAGGSAEGYGTIPYHRTEWTARDITAYFTIDHTQIRAYGLDATRAELLAALARWEIRSLLDHGLRLRTACDLAPIDPADTGTALPDLAELDTELRGLIDACAGRLDHEGALDVRWTSPKKTKVKN